MEKKNETKEKNAIEGEILIDHVGERRLKNPIWAKISYEKYDETTDFWVINNEGLGVVGVDTTVEKAKKDFEEDLLRYYQFYKTIPDNELTERTKKIKEKLIQAFEKV